tara:strand:- start:33956 stop:37279 length:3324 start_codon:yes stop_codon:yes gene_type:complete
MKTNNKGILYLIVISLFNYGLSSAQNDKLWSEETSSDLLLFQKNAKHVTHKKERICRLNVPLFKKKLQESHQKSRSKKSKLIIPFPDQNGILRNYIVTEASTFSPELQIKYPSIRSYIGVSDDSLKTVVRFSMSNFGLNLMKLSEDGNSEFIDPYTKDALTYSIYSKKDLPTDIPKSICNVIEQEQNKLSQKSSKLARIAASDGKLRTYRLALSCTGEYGDFHWRDQGIEPSAIDAIKKEAVLAAMNISMTRINGVFEKEVALTMQLIPGNEALIFLDPDTDGYTSDNDSKMLGEVQDKCDDLFGSAGYDIGHLFTTGESGAALVSSPCNDNIKAQGVSGRTPSQGDSFDIDFVAHEMGHQFGATHTFNNSCSNLIALSSSVEPGSGSTIMGYAGICSPDVQEYSDAYFHGISIEQMYSFLTSSNSSCAEQSDIGKFPPTANAGSNYTIPISTPFALEGTATDDNGIVTYCWEQTDTQTSTMPPLSTSSAGPLFRSLSPNTSEKRHFPDLQTTLIGETGSTWEQLPSIARDLNFKLTVRDNGTPIGQFATDNTKITVFDTTIPFKITSQNTSETFYVGESKTISWNVADTNVAPINTTLVNILFSKDGGLTYPIILAENAPNNGSYIIITPNETTTSGRIKVEAVGNIYYSINEKNITILASNFVMALEENSIYLCAPNDAIYNFEYNTYLGFNEETTFIITGIPDGATAIISPNSAIADGTLVTISISDINSNMQGEYTPILTGDSLSDESNVNLLLSISTNIETEPHLTCPKNNTSGAPLFIEFQWKKEDNVSTYQIEIASDINFNNIIDSSTTDSSTYISNNLEVESTYFWRVKGGNSCGSSDYSLIWVFETGTIDAFEYASDNTPINIPDNDQNGITSTINITDAIEISDLNLTINIEHTYIGDLKISLKSPGQEEIILVPNRDDNGNNYTNTTFDDSATNHITDGSAPYTGSFKPIDPLATFNTSRSNGDWALKISDNELEDKGKLLDWNISFSGIKVIDETCEILSIDIHKAFSPNGDNINDYWAIENINTTGFENDTLPSANVKIFNIRGQVVYRSNGYKNDWDGVSSNGKKLPIGTYIYEVTFSKPEFKTQKGWIYIKY